MKVKMNNKESIIKIYLLIIMVFMVVIILNKFIIN